MPIYFALLRQFMIQLVLCSRTFCSSLGRGHTKSAFWAAQQFLRGQRGPSSICPAQGATLKVHEQILRLAVLLVFLSTFSGAKVSPRLTNLTYVFVWHLACTTASGIFGRPLGPQAQMRLFQTCQPP